MVALDVGGVLVARLDDVGVQRALDEELQRVVGAGPGPEVARDLLEDPDEQLADALALDLGVDHAGERLEEPIRRLHVDELDVELAAEGVLDLLALAFAHEPGVDVDAGQLVADGLVHEGGGHRGVDPARQRAEHPVGAHLGADARDLVLDDRDVRPRRGDLAGVVQEPRESSWPCSVWATSGWNWTPKRRRVGSSIAATGTEAVDAVTSKPGGARGHRDAVAHPDADRSGSPSRSDEAPERTSSVRPYSPASERLDRAAEVLGEQLGAVADAEDRDPELVDARVERGRAVARGRSRGRPRG